MIEDLKEWVAIAVVAVTAVGSWFTLKGDVTVLKNRIADVEAKEHPVVDLTQMVSNAAAIQRLEKAYERADEQRTHLLDSIERMRRESEKSADSQAKFHAEMIKQITQLSTELQERTRALHS